MSTTVERLHRRRERPLNPKALRQVSRAFVSLQDRPALAAVGQELATRCAAALGAELKVEVACTGKLLEAVEAGPLRNRYSSFVELALEATGDTAVVEIEQSFVSALVDRLAGGSGGPFAPSPLTRAETAAAGYLALRCLQAAEANAFVAAELRPRLVSISDRTAAPGDVTCAQLAFTVRFGNVEGKGRVLVPAALLERLGKQAAVELPAPAHELLAKSLEVLVVGGGAPVDESALAELAAGDVVLLDGLTRGETLEADVRVYGPTFHLLGRLTGAELTVASIADALSPESSMAASNTPPPLPVEIQVELGRVRLPLSELGRITAGSVVGLNVTLQDIVTLRLGGEAIARAELVDIEGQVGARILELLK